MVWVAAIGACLGAIVVWQLAMIVILRLFAVKLPFSLAFYIYPRREQELLVALDGRRKDTFVFISGVLMFGCPLFLGLTTYDYVIDRSVSHSFVGSALAFAVMIACGIWIGTSSWNKYPHNASQRS